MAKQLVIQHLCCNPETPEMHSRVHFHLPGVHVLQTLIQIPIQFGNGFPKLLLEGSLSNENKGSGLLAATKRCKSLQQSNNQVPSLESI